MNDAFFQPKSVAVVGVSRDTTKVGSLIFSNLKNYGYKGKLYAVNKKGGHINGEVLYKSLTEIENPVDLCIVSVPAVYVPDILHDCSRKKIDSAVVISSGFSESGSEGKKLEEKITLLARDLDINLLGPNCLGLIDSKNNLNASFSEAPPDISGISIFSQSGAIGAAILDWFSKNELGFSKFISLGNKAQISECELIDYFEKDSKTNVILGYLESIKDGRMFMELSKKLTRKKPFILVKSGRTKTGAKSAMSHTGSIAGSEEAVAAALSQSGVVRADTLLEMFDLGKVFGQSPVPKGSRVAVVSNAGGPIVMVADRLEKTSLSLAEFSKTTSDFLAKRLPPNSQIHNPVDILGDATSERFESALEGVLADDGVDCAIVIATPQIMTDIEKIAKVIVKKQKFKKPILVSFIGGEKAGEGVRILQAHQVPVFDFPEEAVRALDVFCKYYLSEKNDSNVEKICSDEQKKEKISRVLEHSLGSGSKTITEGEASAFDILDAYGIKTVARWSGEKLDDLVKNAKRIGYPVVLKTAAKGVLHKTDVGGIEVGIKDREELIEKYHLMRRNLEKNGITDPKMAVYKQEDLSQEIFIGVKRDDNFGPLVVFGGGGIYVELGNDFAYRIYPFDKNEALKMIRESKTSKILEGYRGKDAANVEKIAEILVSVGRLAYDFPIIKEIDLNPISATGKDAVVLDAKIILE